MRAPQVQGAWALLGGAAILPASAQADPLAAGGAPPGVASAWFTALAVVALLALLALVACAWIVVRLMRQRHDLLGRLRDAGTRSFCLEPLLDRWTWQTDRQHRLLVLRPPGSAAISPGAAPEAPGLVWERFAADDPPALRAIIERAATLDAVPARLAAPGVGDPHGLLSGRPYLDDAGEFAGYHGVFRVPVSTEPPPAEAGPAAPLPARSEPATAAGEHELLSFTVSHDLRAPIRVVEGFTKILKEDYGPALDRVGNDHLDRVLGAAARMNNMIDALMALSRLSSQPLACQPVDLSRLGEYVVDDLRRQSPERQVATRIEPGLQVTGDPTLLRIVLENLLGNAWKYSGKRAEAEISLGRHAGAADTFTVADNGAGFDMRFADRLFGVFQRLHGTGEFPGTGIGLATVRRIVRRHGGDIWAEAEVEQGARFHFSVPGR